VQVAANLGFADQELNRIEGRKSAESEASLRRWLEDRRDREEG